MANGNGNGHKVSQVLDKVDETPVEDTPRTSRFGRPLRRGRPVTEPVTTEAPDAIDAEPAPAGVT